MFDVDCSPIVLEFPVETGHIARDASVILQSKCNFNTASLQFKLLIFYIALPMHVPELVEMKSRRNNQPSYKMRYRMGVRLSSSTQSNRNQPKQIKNSKNHCKTSQPSTSFCLYILGGSPQEQWQGGCTRIARSESSTS